MKEVFDAADKLNKGEILNFITPFLPAHSLISLKTKDLKPLAKKKKLMYFLIIFCENDHLH